MAKLRAAIELGLKSALDASVDRVVRIDVPSTWPVAGAIVDRVGVSDGQRMRVGVLRPFTLRMFTRLDCEKSDDPTRITRWRNEKRRTSDLVVCGRADARNAAGLRDFARVVRRADVIAAWAELEGDVASTGSGKPEIARLINAMFVQCARGRIDAIALDDYLTATSEITPRHVESIFSEMWRARLIPDDQVLDQGASSRRLDTNLNVVARLEAEEEREIRTRLKRAASGADRRANSAKAALEFTKSGSREDLRTARLSDVLDILGRGEPSVPAERAKDFSELLNLLEQEPLQCAEALSTLSNRWHLDDAEASVVEVDATIGEERTRYRIVLRPTIEKVAAEEGSRDVLNSAWVGEGDQTQTLVVWRDQESPEAFEGDRGWKRRTAAEFDQVLAADSNKDVEDVRGPLGEFVRARGKLRRFEPWLAENALELLILKSEAVDAVDEYLRCWESLLQAALRVEAPVPILRLLQFLEASWGPNLEDPKWAVLGPLHPYRLDPVRRVAKEALASVEKRKREPLGDAVAWLMERCCPAYPALYAGERTLHLAKPESQPVYVHAAQEHLPRAEEGHGITRILDSLIGFSPQLANGFVVLLVDPPPGAAIGAEIRRLNARWQGRITVLVASTRPDANPLDEADGDLRYLGRFEGLQELAERETVAAQVVVRFTGQPKGSVAARHGWSATKGSFLAPHLEISLDPLASEDLRPVAEVKVEPRRSNAVVCLSHELYRKQTGSSPKHFQFRPMLPREELESLKKLSRRTDWLVVAAPGPMGLSTPARINNYLSFVGRELFGPYGLYVYDATSLFSVRRFVEQALRNVPVVVGAARLAERLTELAKQSGAEILGMGKDGVESHEAALVALRLAESDLNNADYLDIVLRVDDLGWTRIWIGGESRRCDFLVVRVAQREAVEPKVIIRAVESKSDKSSNPINPSRASLAEATTQIEVTLSALRDVILVSTPTLDQDVRFATFIEHLMAAALASDPNFDDIARLKQAIGTLNMMSSRMLEPNDIQFEGLAVVTQAATNADRVVVTEVATNGTRMTFVRATAKDLTALFSDGSGALPSAWPGQIPETPESATATAGSIEAGRLNDPEVGEPTEAYDEAVTPNPTTNVVAQEGDLGEASPVQSEESTWAERTARDLIQICRRHQVPVADAGPSRILLGPSLLSVSVRLRIGAQLSTIEKRLEDLMRDIGLGDRTKEVSVINDAEPSTVRFLIPRVNREFPELSTQSLPPEWQDAYLPIRIGKTLENVDFISPVESWPHMLVAGTTGSGKTTFLRATLAQLSRFGRKYVQLILVDGKGDTDYVNLIPGDRFVREFPEPLLGHDRIMEVVEWAVAEMDRRREALHRLAGSTGKASALRWPDLFRAEVREGREPQIVPIVVVIDEFADLMHAGRSHAEGFLRSVQRIAQIGRSRMIHLILATQRPDRETIRGAIKTNLDARVVLRLPTAADSLTVLGHGGAERLLKHGDMLFDSGGNLIRLQGYRM